LENYQSEKEESDFTGGLQKQKMEQKAAIANEEPVKLDMGLSKAKDNMESVIGPGQQNHTKIAQSSEN